jgi:hypothetical protein
MGVEFTEQRMLCAATKILQKYLSKNIKNGQGSTIFRRIRSGCRIHGKGVITGILEKNLRGGVDFTIE